LSSEKSLRKGEWTTRGLAQFLGPTKGSKNKNAVKSKKEYFNDAGHGIRIQLLPGRKATMTRATDVPRQGRGG